MLTAIYIMAGVGIVLFSSVVAGLSTLGALVLYRMFTMWRLSRAARTPVEESDAESNSDVSTS